MASADANVQKSALNVVLGTMTFGEVGKEGTRVHDVEAVKVILDVFQKHGHYEVDTAEAYGRGTSELLLGTVGLKERGLSVGTKVYPTTGFPLAALEVAGIELVTHSPEDLRKHLEMSLKALQTDCIDVWYLHAPDRTTPFEVTLKAVDDLYKEGKFKRFGLSNYMSWEVAEIVGICKANGHIQPTIYQGIYNAMHRKVEPELFPCLRKFGIAFYEYNPLGGGFFTGRYRSMQESAEAGSRFDLSESGHQAAAYRARYWNEAYFGALAKVEAAAAQHNLTLAEVALRWVSHHSMMKREYGDAVLIGGSSVKYIEQNLCDLEKGPLPDGVVKVLDEAWAGVEAYGGKYYH